MSRKQEVSKYKGKLAWIYKAAQYNELEFMVYLGQDKPKPTTYLGRDPHVRHPHKRYWLCGRAAGMFRHLKLKHGVPRRVRITIEDY